MEPSPTNTPLDILSDPVIEAYKKDVDRTLLLENLKLTVEQRFQKFESFMQGVMDLRQAGTRFREKCQDQQNQKGGPQQKDPTNGGST